jgi:tRNA pseudouridine32 synthase / 23S rRNA pseudouridine746 synthase
MIGPVAGGSAARGCVVWRVVSRIRPETAVPGAPDAVPAPPVRDGVGASHVRLPEGDWPTVLAFLCARFAGPGAEVWRQRIARGLVTDDCGAPIAADTPYRAGLRVRYYRELEQETPIPFDAGILYRDAHLLVVDKPHFLPVLPAGRYVQQTLLVRLKRALGLDDLVPLHRIDRDTAGLVLFSVNPATRAAYQQLFPRRAVDKTYEAIAPALPDRSQPQIRRSRIEAGEPFFRMREVDGTPNSETRIECIETRGARARYRLTPVTGRKHQLRVHMAALGAPIVNDPFYPELRAVAEDDFSQPLQLLAKSLAFEDPLSGERRTFESRRQLSMP